MSEEKATYKSRNREYPTAIHNWPEDDRPREKLFKNGEHTLSDTELLAILIRNGVKGESAIDLSRKVLQKFKGFRNLAHTDIAQWEEIKGLGKAKIAQIKAAIEIGRRFKETEVKEDRPQIKSSKDVVDILMPRMRDLKKEVFKIILLNSKNRVIDIIEITEGTVNKAVPIIREVFQKALQHFAAAIICVHNHPSGDCNPSIDDNRFNQELIKAGKIMGIKVLDHLIIGDNRHFSFADAGMM
ncbi:MAG: DNA repair protein RadC [Candidatus Omnitrophica bacterium]|nr:DNA repair protein RadC [Candidatus Omnitrophota bacterium]